MSAPADPDEFRQPRFGDVRDDYDDEFGRELTPREMARARLGGPGFAFIVIGVVFLVAAVWTTVGILVKGVQQVEDGSDLALVILGLAGVVVAGVISAVVIRGGMAMLHLNRWRLALTAAYIVSSLSLAGCYAIFIFPLGFWALVVLYDPAVRREFRPAGRVASEE